MTNNTILESLLEINLYILTTSTLWIIIKSKISFKWQRISALLIPILSVFIWALKPILTAKEMVYNTSILTPINVLPTVEAMTQTHAFSVNWIYVYGAISGILFLSFLYKIFRVLIFFRDAVPQGSISVKTSTNEDSFSFFKFIHLRAQMDEDEKQVVLQHELIHYQKRHSFDLVAMEIIHSLFWINPLFFYLKKELVNIHEFEVDQEMYKAHKTNYMRHLLNYALGSVDSHYLLTSPFFNRLTITKRIQTMKTNKNKNNAWLLLSLPLLAIGLSVVSCENESFPEASSDSYEITTQSNENASTPPTPPPPPIPSEHLQPEELSKKAEYPGGQAALFEYMGNNIKYSKEAQQQGISGKVFVQFTVKADGSIAYVIVKRGVSKELDSEAVRVIKNMPNWVPAEKDGKAVASQLTLPIMFALE